MSTEPHELRGELASGWRDLLGCAETDIDDDANFFSFGGTSILAAQLLTRLQRVLGRRPRLMDLLRCETFADQLDLLAATTSAADAAGPGIPPGPAASPSSGSLPLSQRQAARLARASRQTAQTGSTGLIATALVLKLTGPVDVQDLGRAMGDLVERHETLRSSFLGPRGEIRLRVREADPRWRPELLDLRHLPHDQAWDAVWSAIHQTIDAGIDLRLGPLGLALIGLVSGTETAVALLIDHIASDGRSLGILTEDLAELYTARAEGRPSRLPVLPRPAQVVLAEVERDARADAGERLAGWRKLLDGYPSPPSFDLTEHEPGACARAVPGPALHLRSWLGPEVLRRFDEAAGRAGVPVLPAMMGMIYLTAHAYSGASDICLVTPCLRRDAPDADRVVSCFIDPLIVRLTDEFGGRPCRARLADVARHAARCLARSTEIVLPFDQVLPEITGSAVPAERRPWLWCNYMVTRHRQAEFGQAVAEPVAPVLKTSHVPTLRLYLDRSDAGMDLSLVAPERLYPREILAGFLATAEDLIGALGTGDGRATEQVLAGPGAPRCRCAAGQGG